MSVVYCPGFEVYANTTGVCYAITIYNIDTIDANTVVDCTRASWASRGTAVAVAWLCPAQIWTYLDVIF